jgi:molybdopterin/thiamine biosynthesis adenylyltransferase
MGVIPERYTRNRKSLSVSDQIALLQSTMAIIGLGGLGGYVAEVLARTGIGRLILVDGDRFEDSNLNRQLNSTAESIGVSKAAATVRRIAAVNPSVEVTSHDVFFKAENAEQLVADADVVIDCLDTLPARFLLESAARSRNIPMVTAAVAGTTAQVLAIRPGDTGLRSIYGSPEEAPERGVERMSGNLPYTVMMAAAMECAEAVRLLLAPETVDSTLVVFDLRDNTFEKIILER